jgi:PAS domain S-box-containing protein
MLADEIDFYRMYKTMPTAMALLTPDLEIIDVNDEFQANVGRQLEELVGRNIFEVSPKMPEDSGGQPLWTPLEAAMTSGRREAAELMRYDVEDPDHPGVFLERYWAAVAQPIRGPDGQVEVIEVSATDITPIVSHFQVMQSEEERSGGWLRRLGVLSHRLPQAHPPFRSR